MGYQESHLERWVAPTCCTDDEEARQIDILWKNDTFVMLACKVVPCSKRTHHDWSQCPFAHPQERATRRDPRLYTGIACPHLKEGHCAFDRHCPYAHNAFEYWLHPTRYRTQLCKDFERCKRKLCFFAHSAEELRVPECQACVTPDMLVAAASAAEAEAAAAAKRKASSKGKRSPRPSNPACSSRALLQLLFDQQAGADSQPQQQHAATDSQLLQQQPASGPCSSADASSEPPSPPAELAAAAEPVNEAQVIEHVTGMLARGSLNPAQAAAILQQLLPSHTLEQLRSQLASPRTSEDGMIDGSSSSGSRGSGLTVADQLSGRSSFDNEYSAYVAGTHGPRSSPLQAPKACILDQPPYGGMPAVQYPTHYPAHYPSVQQGGLVALASGHKQPPMADLAQISTQLQTLGWIMEC